MGVGGGGTCATCGGKIERPAARSTCRSSVIQYRKLVLELGQGGGALHNDNLAAAHIDLRIVSTYKSMF